MQDELTYMYGKRHEKNYRLWEGCAPLSSEACAFSHTQLCRTQAPCIVLL